MRHTRLLLPILFALMVAACAREQPAYYVTDSLTGQRVASGQQADTANKRGLLDKQSSGARSYAYAPKQRQASSGRGLFNSDVFGSSSPAPVYAYRQPTQTYAYQPPRQAQAAQPVQQASRPVPQQSGVMQYRPPQPYAQQAYAAQQPYYRPPQPQPAGYYAERYRWY